MEAVPNGIATMNSKSVKFKNSSRRSTTAKLVNSEWWFTQVMPMMKKLTTYAAYEGHRSPS